jgi:hypothetical protein
MGIFTRKTKNHPNHMVQDTRDWISITHMVSQQQPPLTLSIICRGRNMAVRQLKLYEGLIKPEPGRMQAESASVTRLMRVAVSGK